MRFTIPGTLPSLNEYISAERSSKYAGAALKKSATESVMWITNGLDPINMPVRISILWVCPNKRKDPDNISSFGTKALLDALVKSNIIPDDTWRYIRSIHHEFAIAKDNPRIEVTLEEVNDGNSKCTGCTG